MFRADDNMKRLYVLPSIWFNPLCFHICRSLGCKLIRLRNIEPIMKELLLRDPLSELNHVPPLKAAAPPLLPQLLFLLHVKWTLPDPLGSSSNLMWLWVSSGRLLLRAGQGRVLMLFLLKENWGAGGFWGVLAVGLSDWKCSTTFFFFFLGLLQPLKRISWCFLLVPSDFFFFFLACIILAS